MPDIHAKLSASGSHRWLNCPPSVKLEQQYKDETSEYAAEGTLAHELGEISLKRDLGQMTERVFKNKLKPIMTNALWTADRPDYVEIDVETCMEKVAEAKAKTPDAVFCVEQKLDFSEWVPGGFGTGDFVIIADGTMEICDLKYGKGVPVSAKDNSQMRLYALGAISEFSFLYDIDKVKMTIIQPRLDSISSDEVTVDELLKWAEVIVKPRAQLAIKGEGEFKAGEHCKFCKARKNCRARAEKNMELAKYDFQEPPTLDDNDIVDILKRLDEFEKWVKDIKDFALEQALNGVNYEGFKVVEGRSNRKYSDENKVAEILLNQGFQESMIYTKKLDGISKLESAIGKKEVQRLIGDLIVKPQGKPTLVSISDKRPVFNPAEADFK